MKTLWRIGFVSLLLAATLAGSVRAGWLDFLTQEHRDWAFVESVGGMSVTQDDRLLNVNCDVSGLQSITRKPTQMNSGIGVWKVQCERVGRTLRLTVITRVIGKGMSTRCGSIDLLEHPVGEYVVEYLDPDGTTHPLGSAVLR